MKDEIMGLKLSLDNLSINCKEVSEEIQNFVRNTVFNVLKKRGVVIGISGGIDSSVTAAICVHALGKEKVFGILMPEKESSNDTLDLSRIITDFFGIDNVLEDITPILDSAGCYQRRNETIRKIIPDFTDEWKFKIVLPSLLDSDSYRVFSLVAKSPNGEIIRKRLHHTTYLEILSATNFKQRVRKMIEYYHADRLNYADVGTPNRLEYDQGFFVKNGDGSADIKPIAHLYKTQIYQLAEYYNIPEIIMNHPPTTDTYSMAQSQEEFFFSVPYDIMDFCLYCYNNDISPERCSKAISLDVDQVKRVYADIKNKRRSSKYLHLSPQLVEPVLPN
jgi:NAD+ synthase